MNEGWISWQYLWILQNVLIRSGFSVYEQFINMNLTQAKLSADKFIFCLGNANSILYIWLHCFWTTVFCSFFLVYSLPPYLYFFLVQKERSSFLVLFVNNDTAFLVWVSFLFPKWWRKVHDFETSLPDSKICYPFNSSETPMTMF